MAFAGPKNRQGPPGEQGLPGLSAYEVAVENGFRGTEQDWLDSLVGPRGPKGPKGEKGEPGETRVIYAGGLSGSQPADPGEGLLYNTGTIPAGNTQQVFSSSNSSGERIFCHFRNLSRTISKQFDMTIRRHAAGLSDSIFGRDGAASINVVASLSGSDIILTVTNNESVDLIYSVKRITL